MHASPATGTAGAGAWLGLVFHWSGSLLVPIAAHAAYDFVALIWLVRKRRRARATACCAPTSSGERGQT